MPLGSVSMNGYTHRWLSEFTSVQSSLSLLLSPPGAGAGAESARCHSPLQVLLEKRFFLSYCVQLCGETHCSEVNAKTKRGNLETGQDRKSRQKSISQLVVRVVTLIVSWIDCIAWVCFAVVHFIKVNTHSWGKFFLLLNHNQFILQEREGKSFHFHLHLKKEQHIFHHCR